MHSRADARIKPWAAVFGAKNDMENDLAEGLWHKMFELYGVRVRKNLMKQAVGLQQNNNGRSTQGVAPFALGWYESGLRPEDARPLPPARANVSDSFNQVLSKVSLDKQSGIFSVKRRKTGRQRRPSYQPRASEK